MIGGSMTEEIKNEEVVKEDAKKEVLQKTIGSITDEELKMLTIRNNVIGGKKTELELLENECDNFLSFLRNKYKLETGKEFIINNDGKIIETIKQSEE